MKSILVSLLLLDGMSSWLAQSFQAPVRGPPTTRAAVWLPTTTSSSLQQATSSQNLKQDQQQEQKRTRRKVRTAADIASVARKRKREVAAAAGRAFSTASPGIGDLVQLTEAIDERLLSINQETELHHQTLKSRESMNTLVAYNHKHTKGRKARKKHEICVIFGKPLIDDQVTVEYASRIRAAAQLFLSEDEKKPDLICFCGGVSKGAHISSGDAGFMFFKQLCLSQNIDLDGVEIFIERSSAHHEGKALKIVVNHIMKESVRQWLAVSLDQESPKDEFGMARTLQRKKVHLHFLLISSEYHLCNLNDIHQRSPNQSILRPIEMLRSTERSDREIMTDEDELSAFRNSKNSNKSGKKNKPRGPINGIVHCSWAYRYQTYPYTYTSNAAAAFMGKCFLLGEELLPLFINLKGVVSEKEFFQRDNYVAAAAVRHTLVSLMEELYRESPTLHGGLREILSYGDSTVDIVLEGATLSLGRCIDLIRPAGLHQGSVNKKDFIKALRSLDHCMSQIRTYCDPDAPVELEEWGTMSGRDDMMQVEDSSNSSATGPLLSELVHDAFDIFESDES